METLNTEFPPKNQTYHSQVFPQEALAACPLFLEKKAPK